MHSLCSMLSPLILKRVVRLFRATGFLVLGPASKIETPWCACPSRQTYFCLRIVSTIGVVSKIFGRRTHRRTHLSKKKLCPHPATIFSRLKKLGYSYKGEFNIPNRLFFEKKNLKACPLIFIVMCTNGGARRLTWTLCSEITCAAVRKIGFVIKTLRPLWPRILGLD